MITYRVATADDVENIARLHARSWQLHYRGPYPDKFLDEEVEEERLQVWTKRYSAPNPNQYNLLALDGDQLCGFGCIFLHYDAEWGTLLDNLHVAPEYKGHGIGRELMRRTASWAYERAPEEFYHLMVLATNTPAIQFYERMGGRRVKSLLYPVPYDSQTEVHLYVWEDYQALIGVKA